MYVGFGRLLLYWRSYAVFFHIMILVVLHLSWWCLKDPKGGVKRCLCVSSDDSQNRWEDQIIRTLPGTCRPFERLQVLVDFIHVHTNPGKLVNVPRTIPRARGTFRARNELMMFGSGFFE